MKQNIICNNFYFTNINNILTYVVQNHPLSDNNIIQRICTRGFAEPITKKTGATTNVNYDRQCTQV